MNKLDKTVNATATVGAYGCWFLMMLIILVSVVGFIVLVAISC